SVSLYPVFAPSPSSTVYTLSSTASSTSLLSLSFHLSLSFFFNDTATTEIYTLSLHDALPISCPGTAPSGPGTSTACPARPSDASDRKSTRLNSSHVKISYAVFCLKKKKDTKTKR